MLYTLHTLLLLQQACSCEIVLLAANRRETLSYASSNHELRSCHPHVSHLSKQQCGHPAGLLRTLPMCHLLGSSPPTQQGRLRGATPTLFKNGCRGPRPVVTRMYVQPLHQGEKKHADHAQTHADQSSKLHEKENQKRCEKYREENQKLRLSPPQKNKCVFSCVGSIIHVPHSTLLAITFASATRFRNFCIASGIWSLTLVKPILREILHCSILLSCRQAKFKGLKS